jgi:hypothetical protein
MNDDDARHDHAEPAHGDAQLARLLEEWSDILERAVRDELDESERQALERACEENPELREAFEDARLSRQLFAALRPERAPGSLETRILAAIDADVEEAGHEAPIRSRQRRTPRQGRRPAFAPWWGVAAAAAVVLLALFLPGRMMDFERNRRADELAREDAETLADRTAGAEYSEAEVRAAAEEMRLALALVARTMDRTSEVLRLEMREEVRDRVTHPLEEGIETGLRAIPMFKTVPREDEHSRILSPPRGDC